jgi:hypothetical protein
LARLWPYSTILDKPEKMGRDKHVSLFLQSVGDEEKKVCAANSRFSTFDRSGNLSGLGAIIIKLFTVVKRCSSDSSKR